MDTEMGDATTHLNIFHFEPAQLLNPQSMIKESGKDRPVTLSFQGSRGGSVEEPSDLVISKGGSLPLIGSLDRTLHAHDRIEVHRV